MLSINTNLSSMIAQNSMKTSTAKLDQTIERMTTGAKINHTKDNAANYSIATNITTKMGAYMVAEDNVLKGFDMTNAASESLSLIEGNLKRIRSLAIQASNGAYGNQSLNAINSEAVALVDEINRIYSTAEYNGLKVFKPVAQFEIPDGVGTTGNVGVQSPITYSMRATNYGEFIDNPYTYTDEEVADMKTITQAISESSLVSDGEYSISTIDELVALANYVNAGNDTTGMTFVLGANIDLSSISNWTPIGDSTNKFKGTFDGNGHTISNLTINRSASYQGLFGYTNSGSVLQNVGLENINIAGTSNIGGLVGVSASSVTNCYATGIISGTGGGIGGLIGRNPNATKIINCYTNCNVSSSTSDYAGGLVSYTKGEINNCYSNGNVNGIYGVGGLVGRTDGNVKNSYATGNVKGNSKVGGLVGYTEASGVASITNSYATGDVNGTSNVGGLVGLTYSFANSVSISNCYAAGDVKGTTTVGGLVGSNIAKINNSYTTGDVDGSTSVGGLMGSGNTYTSVSNSYVTGNVSGENYVGGLVGKINKTSGTLNITNSLSYSTVSGNDSDSTGSLIGGAVVTTNNSTFVTLNLTGCKVMSNDINTIGGSYMYANSTYTLLDTYDMSTMLSGISLYVPEITSVTLQVGTDAQASSQITFDMAFMLENIDSLYQIGQDTTTDFVSIIDDLLATVSAKQTEFGAVQNRLESALDEISTQYENLASSRSTIRDVDMAKVSSQYIQQQILQDASATLLSSTQNIQYQNVLGLLQSLNG